MKEARKVNFEDGQKLSYEEFDDLYTHARNSALWYSSNYPLSKYEIRNKLYKKGYPEGVVTFYEKNSKKTQQFNIVENVMKFLEDSHFVDDEQVALSHAKKRKRLKYGPTRTADELRNKRIENTIIENVITEIYDTLDENVRYTKDGEIINNELLSLVESLYKKFHKPKDKEDNNMKLRLKIIQKTVYYGWDMDESMPIIDEFFEDL